MELQEKVVQVSAGDSHTAALTEDGRVFVWGSFRVCQSQVLEAPLVAAAPGAHPCVSLRSG